MRGNRRGVVANVLAYDIVVNEFEISWALYPKLHVDSHDIMSIERIITEITVIIRYYLLLNST